MTKPFSESLRMLQGGVFNAECGELFANVLKGVEETGKAGKLTLTIDVKKAGAAVAISAKATDKTPEDAPAADLFWTTPEGNLTQQNPAQSQLDLQPVQVSPRVVHGAQGE